MSAARKAPAVPKALMPSPTRARVRVGGLQVDSLQAITFAVPYLGAGVLFGFGALAHVAWGEKLPDQTLVALAFTLLAGALAVFTWAVARPRNPLIRATATATVSIAGCGLVTLLVFGVTRVTAAVYWIPAVALCLAWNITRTPAVRGTGEETRGGLDEILKLPGAKARTVAVTDDQVVMEITTAGTQGFRDVQKAGGAMANLVDLPPGAVRVQQGDPNRGRLARVTFTKRDMLREVIDWPGASTPGTYGPYDPIYVGMYQDAVPATFMPRTHTVIMGMSEAGKSTFGQVVLGELAVRPGVVVWYSDPAKGVQTAGPLVGAFDWAAFHDPAATKAMVYAVLRVAKARSNRLGELGMIDWAPEIAHEMPLLVVWFEEAAAILNEHPKFVEATEQVRSSGIRIVASLQRASADRMQTSARSNFGQAICFGVGDDYSAGFVLTDSTLDAGAAPHAWKTSKPGCCYMESPVVDQERWPVPLRGAKAKTSQLAEAVEAGAGVRSQLDAISVAAADEPYAKRRQVTGGQPINMTKGTGVDGDVEVDDMGDEAETFRVPAQPDPLADEMDPGRPIPPYVGPEIVFEVAGEDPAGFTPEAARREFLGMLARFMEAGRDVVSTSEICDAWPHRRKPWVHQELTRLIEAGQVERSGHGRYRLLLLVGAGLSGGDGS